MGTSGGRWWRLDRGGGTSDSGLRWQTVQLRLWPLAAATAALPALQFALALRRRKGARAGLCPRCGYDLILSPKPVIAILPGEQPRQPTPRR